MTDAVLSRLQNPPERTCDVCWNSHGCDLPEGHGGPLHHCLDIDAPCSMILWSQGEGWVRWDKGERVGVVEPFHACSDDPVWSP